MVEERGGWLSLCERGCSLWVHCVVLGIPCNYAKKYKKLKLCGNNCHFLMLQHCNFPTKLSTLKFQTEKVQQEQETSVTVHRILLPYVALPWQNCLKKNSDKKD